MLMKTFHKKQWETLTFGQKCMVLDDVRDNHSPIENMTFIYLLWDTHSDLVKIGRSNNLENRRETLEKSWQMSGLRNSELIYLFAFRHIVDMEKLLHEEFVDSRVTGEWFRLTPIDIMQILFVAGENGNILANGDSSLKFTLKSLEAGNV
jgi:hypothetical protein